jgi:hypothetical protein
VIENCAIATMDGPRHDQGGTEYRSWLCPSAPPAPITTTSSPVPGSMDLGRSAGGLPPDEIVEDTDAALAATEEAVRRFHDP